MSVYDWSATALDNDNADANINWLEGQNPNTVNNSARAMMAAIAAFIKVITGQATSGGSADAYTLTSPTGHAFTSYITGMTVCFLANHTNTGAATLNVDGVGAKSLRKFGSTNVISGDIETGNLVLAIYDGTNFQILNHVANNVLQAFTALVPVADRLAYFDGSSSMALTTLTAFARTLLDDADAATMRATLGLVIGTDVQAFDAQLAAVAALSPSADRLDYWTGPTTKALATLTSFARTLLDDANASAARSTLGVPENTRNITFGTAAPGSLATGEIYLRHD